MSGNPYDWSTLKPNFRVMRIAGAVLAAVVTALHDSIETLIDRTKRSA